MPLPSRCSAPFGCASSPAVPLALASNKLRPLLLCVNYGEALESISRLIGDHLVERALDFNAICHLGVVPAPLVRALRCR